MLPGFCVEEQLETDALTLNGNPARITPVGEEVESHYRKIVRWRIVTPDGDSGAKVMAQTFDIRFARSAGLAALLEVPLNRFRWKGGGHLRIDAQGMSIGVKRGLLALFGARHTQHISNENLRSVYREGEALRVEFEAEGSARIVLPFWAGDRETAEKIVRLLPTSQTVELEHTTDATQSGNPNTDWRVLLIIGFTLALGIAASWVIYSRTSFPPPMASGVRADAKVPPDAANMRSVETAPPPTAGEAPPSSAAPMAPPARGVPIQVFDSIPEVTTSDVPVFPIAPGTSSYVVAVRELTAFERDAALLEFDYRESLKLLMTGGLSPDAFAEKLEDLEMRWWEVTFRIYDSTQLEDPALLDLRRVMLGAARRWRNFLSEYATGLRSRDKVMIAGPLAEVARAQEMRARAWRYVR